MDRFVKIQFQGKFDQFFIVTYQIFDSSAQVIEQGEATLPPCLELVASIQDWRKAYHAEVKHPRLESVEASISNSSDINHVQLASNLKKHLNAWLNFAEFLPVKDRLISIFNPDQVILIGIDISDPELKYAPWHLWSFFEQFTNADYTLLRPSFSKVNSRSSRKSKLNVLAIIGDSRGIDTTEDTTVIKNLPYIHSPKILGEPSRNEVKEVLQGADSIDILFFAGHGMKVQDKGKICINKSDSLSIGEIKSYLRQRIKQGLQLAIFNSCDGLELGEEIADLHIPQAIVMKEAVPDKIAQKFLKSFLQDFSQGVPFVQALRKTRDKLVDEDHEYPYASWLPVLYCNPTEPLLQWPKPNLVQRYPWRSGLAASCLIGLVGLVGLGEVSLIPSMMTGKTIYIPRTSLEQIQNFKYENVELSYPMNWVAQKELDRVNGDIAKFYVQDNREVIVGLFIRKLDTPMSLEDYYNKKLVEELKGGLDKSQIKRELATLGSKGGYKIFITGEMNGKRHKKMVVFTLKNNQAYIMLYSAPEELFSSYEATAEEVIGSLKFLDW